MFQLAVEAFNLVDAAFVAFVCSWVLNHNVLYCVLHSECYGNSTVPTKNSPRQLNSKAEQQIPSAQQPVHLIMAKEVETCSDSQ
jgi:hypothetical protein